MDRAVKAAPRTKTRKLINTNKTCKHRAISKEQDIIPIKDVNLNRLRKFIKYVMLSLYIIIRFIGLTW